MCEMDRIIETIETCIECELCVEDCEFLKQVCESPRELAEKFRAGYFREKPQVAYSCNLCDLCERLCPDDLNIGRMCLAARRQLLREGLAPLPQHQVVKTDQEWVASEWFTVIRPAPRVSGCERFFFPGCNLSGYSPDLVIKTYEYLQDRLPGTGIILGCCGSPTYEMGDQARFGEIQRKIESEMQRAGALELIVCCPYCYHTLRENAPNLRLGSIYEIMAELGLPEGTAGAFGGRTFSLHDPCRTRFEQGIQDSVRLLARKMGCEIEEMEYSRDTTRCCGMGGMVAYVDFKLVNRVTLQRVKEAPFDILTYCASCRGAFARIGKPSLHILDLAFNPEWQKGLRSPAENRSAIRENQQLLKSQLLEASEKSQ